MLNILGHHVEQHYYISILGVMVFVVILAYKKGKRDQIISDFKSPLFILMLMVVITMIMAAQYDKNSRYKTAIKQATIALIISYFAHLDLIFSAFFFTWMISFYYHDNT